MEKNQFRRKIWKYYKKHGRHTLPWRLTHDPYKILISEVMLQQTQVGRVEKKYKEFLSSFPTLKKLANADLSEVLKVWQGLGYNRRAKFLRDTARKIVGEFGGKLPHDPTLLAKLPGIGPNTAGSIRAFAFNQPVVFIETNIRGVYLHEFFPKKKKVRDEAILKLVEETLDTKKPREWYYALMDYGVFLKTTENPNHRSAHYTRQSKFKGSIRELRAKILRFLNERPQTKTKILEHFKEADPRINQALTSLEKDALIHYHKGRYSIAV